MNLPNECQCIVLPDVAPARRCGLQTSIFLIKDMWEGRISLMASCPKHVGDFESLNHGTRVIRELSKDEATIFFVMCR